MTILWTAIIIIVGTAMIIFFEKWKQRDEKKRVAKLKKEIDDEVERLLEVDDLDWYFDEYENAISK